MYMTRTMDTLKRFGLILALTVAFLQLSIVLTGAQSITGLSSFVVSQNSTSVYLNNSNAVPFKVVLASGTPGTTYLIIANGNYLQSKGIYIGLNKSSGTPSFNDTLYINTNVKSGVVPGTYNITIESGGADPLYPGVVNYSLTVYDTPEPKTTATTSPTTSYSVTSAPTTVSQTSSKQSSTSLLSLGVGAIIVILVIIILVFLALKAKK